jgi:hypothetical protein
MGISGAGFDGKVILHDTAADTSTVSALNTTFGGAWLYGHDEPDDTQELSTQMRRGYKTNKGPFLIATWVKQEDSAELAEQAGLWRRTRIGDLYS